MKIDKTWIPNSLSLSRIGFAIIIFLAAITKHWLLALSALLAGLTTDWLDGYLAIRLNAKSELGRMLEDPCDLSLALGSVAGLLFTGIISWSVVIGGGLVCGILASGLLLAPEDSRYFRFSNGMTALAYLAVVLGCTYIYTSLALGPATALRLLPLGIIVLGLAGWVKSERLRDWLTW